MKNSGPANLERSIVLAGNEWVLVKKALDEVRQALRDTFGDFTQLPVDPTDSAFLPATLIDHIATADLGAVHKLVVVDPAEGLEDGVSNKLIAWAPNLPAWVTLVLRFRDAKAGAAFARRAQKTTRWRVYDCGRPRSRRQPALVGWVRRLAQSNGKQIAARAAELLVETSGLSLTTLDNEIEKLCLFVGSRKRISTEDVGRVAAGGAAATAFELADAVAQRNPVTAMKSARRLADSGARVEMVIPLLAKSVRRMWHLKRSRGRTEFTGAARKDFGKCPKGVMQHIARMAKKWKTIELMYALNALLDADYAAKTSRAGHEVILETLVPSLLRRAGTPTAGRRG